MGIGEVVRAQRQREFRAAGLGDHRRGDRVAAVGEHDVGTKGVEAFLEELADGLNLIGSLRDDSG